jgi:AraC family transcriptional regulator, transcriptional activator of pobA
VNKLILRFKEINDFFETTGFSKRTDIPDFYIFSFAELNANSAVNMPPYQKDWYQVSFIANSESSTFSINDQQSLGQQNILYFLSPEHIFSWKRDTATQGFVCYFKPNFLGFFNGSIDTDFSFFNLTEQNILNLDAEAGSFLANEFQKLYTEFNTSNSYRVQILQSSLLALLFKIKSLNEAQHHAQNKPTAKGKLYVSFKNLLNNRYLTEKQVNYYAESLAVRPAYLNDIVKEMAGKTAKELITDKIVLEAKKLLQYSADDIAQIAYTLGFEEATNFIRFFKTNTQTTPKDYRMQLP